INLPDARTWFAFAADASRRVFQDELGSLRKVTDISVGLQTPL
ncbi:hypothetical protein HMP0015_2744, partial [Acinetobacter haemolyticus ATCC 19194]